jgi:hypothetical protein
MMSWTDALNVVERLAPAIATGLGTPLLGGAVAALENVFGLTPKDNASITDRQNSLAVAIAGATPEQLAAMRRADQDYMVRMTEAGFKDTEALAALAVQDRVSARQMQMSTQAVIPAILAIVVTLGFFGTLAMMMFHIMPTDAHDSMMLMLGALGASWGAVVQFYFGSSAGSADKTRLLAKAGPVSPD